MEVILPYGVEERDKGQRDEVCILLLPLTGHLRQLTSLSESSSLHLQDWDTTPDLTGFLFGIEYYMEMTRCGPSTSNAYEMGASFKSII